VTGPLLYLICINDINEAAEAVDILTKITNDTMIGNTIISEADQKQLQEALDNLTIWSEKWGMQFNVKKCKVAHFGRKNKKHENTILGEKLPAAETETERERYRC
jgi:hypothetical protein